jgi:hypothetical protein
LDHLPTGDQEAAALLLIEVLQEQGRWAESASVLHNGKVSQSSALGTIFSILAQHRTVSSTGDQLTADVARLHSIVEHDSAPVITRLKAANVAAQLMGDIRNQTISNGLLKAVCRIDLNGLTEDEKHRLNLCRAQLLYYAGQQRASLQVLSQLSTTMHARGSANSTLVRVHAGLGAVRCYEGNYSAAKEEFGSGHSMAVRIGNESQQALLAAQLSLCCLRLGDYTEQLEWGKKAAAAGQPLSPYLLLQIAYYEAFALALRQDTRGAAQALVALDSTAPSEGPLWLTQARQLLRADILCLCGQRSSALALAREALLFPQPVLRAPSFAGAFARWLALVAEGEGTLKTIEPTLDELWGKLEGFDAVDRAEITCAKLIASTSDNSREELQSILRGQLADLPPAIVVQLGRLGVLRINND